MKTLVYALLFISIPCAFLVYIGHRLIIAPQVAAPFNSIGWMALFFALLITPLSAVFHRMGIENTFTDTMSWIGYVFLGFISLVLAFLVIRDLSWLGGVGIKKVASLGLDLFSDGSSNNLPDQGMRIMILNATNMGIYIIAGILTFFGCAKARQIPSIKHVDISFKDLHPDLEKLKIVQITDFHVSSTLKGGWVSEVVDIVNSLSPDIIFFTGDLVDGSVARLRHDVAPLSDLSATYGCYFVTGNHEYYSGPNRWIKELTKLGFTVLMNEHKVITHGSGKMVVGGVPDYSAGYYLNGHRSNPKKAMDDAPDADLKILLAHQPKSIFKAAKAGFDLVIAGHTHGGQYFPWHYVVSLDQPYVSGLHTFKNTQIYVSRGTGYWGPPMRIAAPPEITLINLKNA